MIAVNVSCLFDTPTIESFVPEEDKGAIQSMFPPYLCFYEEW